MTTTVSDPGGLLTALDAGATEIVVQGEVSGMPSITLGPGVSLTGGTLRFGARGIRLTRDNTLSHTRIVCPDHEVAIGNATDRDTFGSIVLTDVQVIGQVLITAEDDLRHGALRVDGLVVTGADVRGRANRSHAYGVDALQGALPRWNRQPDRASVLTADLRRISVGSEERPIRGSGVVVGGHSDREGRADGGRVVVSVLETGTVVTDGGIPDGTPDLISGGVFVQPGATVQLVRNTGPVTTLGPNDMVLDNWGDVVNWVAEAPITSHGPSGIGFVNFGTLHDLRVLAPIETWGQGARGFNLYDGSLDAALFDSVTTHGDGAVGIQITVPMPKLVVMRDVVTTGGAGASLVRGRQVRLQAVAFSLKPGGSLESLSVGGRIATSGDDVVSMEMHGPIRAVDVTGGVTADGHRSDAVHVSVDTTVLADLALRARDGATLVRSEERAP